MKRKFLKFVCALMIALTLISSAPLTESMCSDISSGFALMSQAAKAKKKIRLKKSKVNITVGFAYTQKLLDEKGKAIPGKKVKWKSSNKKVATVSKSGKVIAKKTGKAKITATYGGNDYTFTVRVKRPAVSYKNITLSVGETFRQSLKNTAGKNIKNKKIVWTSDNVSIAVVDADGVIKAKKAGKVTITAIYKGKKYKSVVTVYDNRNDNDIVTENLVPVTTAPATATTSPATTAPATATTSPATTAPVTATTSPATTAPSIVTTSPATTAPTTTVPDNELSDNDINVGETITVNILREDVGYIYLYKFTPEVTDTYTLYSISDKDTIGGLYDENIETVLASNDDISDSDRNFRVSYVLQAGTTYYWAAGFASDTEYGSFDIALVRGNVTGDTEEPTTQGTTTEEPTTDYEPDNPDDDYDDDYSSYPGVLELGNSGLVLTVDSDPVEISINEVTPFVDISWWSDDLNVAYVDDGTVTPMGPGYTTVTASITVNGTTYFDECEIYVEYTAEELVSEDEANENKDNYIQSFYTYRQGQIEAREVLLKKEVYSYTPDFYDLVIDYVEMLSAPGSNLILAGEYFSSESFFSFGFYYVGSSYVYPEHTLQYSDDKTTKYDVMLYCAYDAVINHKELRIFLSEGLEFADLGFRSDGSVADVSASVGLTRFKDMYHIPGTQITAESGEVVVVRNGEVIEADYTMSASLNIDCKIEYGDNIKYKFSVPLLGDETGEVKNFNHFSQSNEVVYPTEDTKSGFIYFADRGWKEPSLVSKEIKNIVLRTLYRDEYRVVTYLYIENDAYDDSSILEIFYVFDAFTYADYESSRTGVSIIPYERGYAGGFPGVYLDTDAMIVSNGYSEEIGATANLLDDSVSWISDDETIATVEDGYVTGKKDGETTITAFFNYEYFDYYEQCYKYFVFKDTCKVIVEPFELTLSEDFTETVEAMNENKIQSFMEYNQNQMESLACEPTYERYTYHPDFYDLVQSYVDAITAPGMNLEIASEYTVKGNEKSYFSYGLDYTGDAEVTPELDMPFNEYYDKNKYDVTVMVNFDSSFGDRGNVRLYCSEGLEFSDLGYRSDGTQGGLYAGESIMSSLVKKGNLYLTGDGRFSAKMGETVVLKDGVPFAVDVTISEDFNYGFKVSYMCGYMKKSYKFTFPKNNCNTGVFKIKRDLFSDEYETPLAYEPISTDFSYDLGGGFSESWQSPYIYSEDIRNISIRVLYKDDYRLIVYCCIENGIYDDNSTVEIFSVLNI